MANKFLHAAISTHIIEVDYEFFFLVFPSVSLADVLLNTASCVFDEFV